MTRSLAAGPDGILYVSIGSSCDVCEESDPRRAAIWRLDPTSGSLEPYARGLRNAVGLAWNPDGSALWATENERNAMGEETPPDEVVAVRPGADYGWPACYGDRVPMPGYGTPERCAATDPPTLQLPAHSAPLGLAFTGGSGVPAAYGDDLFVALHGSAVRDQPVGYEVVRIPLRGTDPEEPRVFMRGWLVGDDSWGRPVGPFLARDGTLYLTDDKGGVVYWIRPSTEARSGQ
jgi:glucose/arabinose dehydrogenase